MADSALNGPRSAIMESRQFEITQRLCSKTVESGSTCFMSPHTVALSLFGHAIFRHQSVLAGSGGFEKMQNGNKFLHSKESPNVRAPAADYRTSR